ncbi:MAG: isoaspartyl peptidase/L-asparaginase [Nitrospiraceae bacterium]|nr:MAG: isoaspartyl peptidase/L-asparaginase [Nitrospiraceae bacterium]
MTTGGSRKPARGLKPLPEPDERALKKLQGIRDRHKRINRIYRDYFSTVGAVARDREGNLAAGTLTGGVPAMLPGRVDDTPIIGAGVYADDSLGAVSCTGMGEAIVKITLAKEICMNLAAWTPARAARWSLKRILAVGGRAGVIVISSKGQFTISHNTAYMASDSVKRGRLVVRESFSRKSPWS